ncbi:hypothetical protein L1987_51587 [Smallanthus sonchifolius]|uniref:Uncharacterized protein n=1 Tax=Smallanthus sonchifolius TaxID=185202 RepID=A0ACB9ER24_9ASTR|nr:hypothetical protein L1987_51587 [Smallanthus sonchifolius]
MESNVLSPPSPSFWLQWLLLHQTISLSSCELNPEQERKFATGGRTKVPLYVTGVVKVDDAKVAVHEGNIVESEKEVC